MIDRVVIANGWYGCRHLARLARTRLASAVAAGATVLPLESTAGLPGSGQVRAQLGESVYLIAYTGKDGNTLTGVSGVTAPLAEGVYVTHEPSQEELDAIADGLVAENDGFRPVVRVIEATPKGVFRSPRDLPPVSIEFLLRCR